MENLKDYVELMKKNLSMPNNNVSNFFEIEENISLLNLSEDGKK